MIPPPSLYRFQYAFTTSDRQSLVPNVFYYQSQPLFTSLDPVGLSVGGRYLNSKAGAAYQREIHWRSHAGAKGSMLILSDDLLPFVVFQVARGRARRDVHTPNIRSGNWKESSSSVFTSTKRSVCSFRGCSTWQIARSRFGSKTEGWRRRNWTETVYSTTPRTPCYKKNWTKTADTHLSLLHTHLYHYLDRRTRF